MALQNKNTSAIGVIYEPNNFMAFTTTDSTVPEEFHPLIKFLAGSKLNYCLHEAPTIQYEFLEEFWTSAEYKKSANKISFICKGKPYTIFTYVLRDVLRLPENNSSVIASDEDIRKMLSDLNYVVTPSSVHLGEVARRYFRR